MGKYGLSFNTEKVLHLVVPTKIFQFSASAASANIQIILEMHFLRLRAIFRKTLGVCHVVRNF